MLKKAQKIHLARGLSHKWGKIFVECALIVSNRLRVFTRFLSWFYYSLITRSFRLENTIISSSLETHQNSRKKARMLSCLCSFCESCLAEKMATFPAELECSLCGEVTLVTSINDMPIDYTKAANSSRSLRLDLYKVHSNDHNPKLFKWDYPSTIGSGLIRN